MTIQQVTDPKMPISEVLKQAGSEGVLLEAEGEARFALIPLDNDLLDFLLERSPKLIEECNRIRERMRAGRYYSHSAVKKMLDEENPE